MMELIPKVAEALQELRRQRPLIHHITNFVTMTDCANATLAIGASPTMTNAVEEVAEMAVAAKALVLNLGTLQQWTLEAMLVAGKAAAAHGVPIIFDPVGAGGTTFRTRAALKLLDELPLAVIRGNAAEITCLAAHKSGQNLGVDSRMGPVGPAQAAVLADHIGTTVAITGAVDVISDGQRTAEIHNGCPMLTYVTGTGCMTTSLIASFAAVTEPFTAAAGGILAMDLSGERALARGGQAGPGTFHTLLFDAFYELNDAVLQQHGKVLMNRE